MPKDMGQLTETRNLSRRIRSFGITADRGKDPVIEVSLVLEMLDTVTGEVIRDKHLPNMRFTKAQMVPALAAVGGMPTFGVLFNKLEDTLQMMVDTQLALEVTQAGTN